MEDLIRANALSRLDSLLDSENRAARLVTSEDEAEEDFDETIDPEKPVDEEGGDDTDMSIWEN